jgi:hypothetical protein
MIRIVEGYKALWMLRCAEDSRVMLDADDLVGRSMHHKQGFAQAHNPIVKRLSFRIDHRATTPTTSANSSVKPNR